MVSGWDLSKKRTKLCYKIVCANWLKTIELSINERLPSDVSITHEMKANFAWSHLTPRHACKRVKLREFSLAMRFCKQSEQVNKQHVYKGNFGKATETKIIRFFLFHRICWKIFNYTKLLGGGGGGGGASTQYLSSIVNFR